MDIFSEVTPVTFALISFMVISGVKLVDQAFDKDLRGASKILSAALIGAALGYLSSETNAVVGAAAGIAASGLVTTVGYTKRTTPVDLPPKPAELG